MNRMMSRRQWLQLASSALLGSMVPLHFPRLAWAAPALPLPLVKEVEAALGFSLIYEEYKGNYAEAQRLAEQALAEARHAATPARLAEALWTRGLVCVLQGEPATGLALFQEMEELLPDDSVNVLRARTGAFAASYLQFGTFPSGASANGVEVSRYEQVKLDYAGRYQKAKEQVQEGTPDRQAAELITALFFEIVIFRDSCSSAQLFLSEAGDKTVRCAKVTLDRLHHVAESLGEPRWLAYLALLEADFNRRAREYDQAASALAQAKALYEQAADVAGLAAAWLMAGDWSAAPLSTPGVWNFIVTASSLLINADSSLPPFLNEAERDRSRLEPAQARTTYAQAETLYRRAGAPRGLAALHLRYGYLAVLDGDYPTAIQEAGRAAESFQASGDRLGYWCARTHQALARIGAGEFAEDRETARAIGAWGAAEGSFSYALGLGMMCGRAGYQWLQQAGDYERALACFRLAEKLYQVLGAGINQGESVADQGGVFRAIGEQAAAVTALRRAVDVYQATAERQPTLRKSADFCMAAIISGSLFSVYIGSRNVEGMEWIVMQGRAILDELASQPPETKETERKNAEDQMAPMLLAFYKSRLGIANVLIPVSHGIQARKDGDSAEAERLFQEALTRARNSRALLGDAMVAFLEAVIHRVRKDYPAARRAFERYLQQELQRAQRDLQQATLRGITVLVGEAKRRVQNTHDLAVTFLPSIKAYEAAREHLLVLEEQGGKDWWQRTDQPWSALSNRGLVYEGLGQWQTADADYQQAIELLERQRQYLRRDELKTALVSGLPQQELYFQAARNALAWAAAEPDRQQHLMQQSFTYAERGKARGLLDLMAGGAGVLPGAMQANTLLASWRQVNAKLTTWQGLLVAERARPTPQPAYLAYLQQQIATEEDTLRQLESTLATADPNFYRLINPQATLLDVAGIAARLPPGTALLQYYFLDEDLFGWVINHQGLVQTHHANLDIRALERQIRTLHSGCERHTTLDATGEALADTLLAPFAETLASHPHLLIVPYGAAHQLPFHILPWQGEPLIATHTVAYLPSASTLQFVRQSRSGTLPDTLLAVGNPAAMAYQPPFGAPPEPLPPLPAAEVEAKHVAALFPQGRALLGADATVAAVREALPRYSLLHFATHGHLAEDNPLLSAILLAQGGALTVYDLLGLRLQADLVVMSACRTGQGKATGGDDVLGLTRGLLAAGAQAVVVSLWPVDDLATSLLMEAFYQGLRQGNPAAVALQQAQNHLRSLSPQEVQAERDRVAQARGVVLSLKPHADTGYSHPYYWAPFILVG
jgi:CHAT domain-containing protein